MQGGEPALGSGRGGRRGDGRLVVGGWEGGREEGWWRERILSISIWKHFRWGGVTLLPESKLDQSKDI